MPRLPRRLRRPQAGLLIEAETAKPPDESSGGLARVTVTLRPEEPLQVSCGRLELALLTTRFSRTVLDGYQEHTFEEVWRTIALYEPASVRPGIPLVSSAEVLLPQRQGRDSRPVRMQWQAKAHIEVAGHRDLLATRVLLDVSPAEGIAPPVVDGRGFLPL